MESGEAKSETEDPERSLTDKGKLDVARMAQWARQSEIKVHKIRHCGKRQAEKTAGIIDKNIHSTKGVIRVTRISPNGEPAPIVNLIDLEDESLMLVGDLPFY